jgi:hypothetical protein
VRQAGDIWGDLEEVEDAPGEVLIVDEVPQQPLQQRIERLRHPRHLPLLKTGGLPLLVLDLRRGLDDVVQQHRHRHLRSRKTCQEIYPAGDCQEIYPDLTVRAVDRRCAAVRCAQ